MTRISQPACPLIPRSISASDRERNPSIFAPKTRSASRLPRSLIALTGILLLIGPARAVPPPAPIHFQAIAPTHPLKAGAIFDLVLHAAIDPGWHLYALTEPEDGPIATEINLTEGDPAELLRTGQSRPRTSQDPVFGKPVTLFESSATFTLHLQLARALPPGAHLLHVLVRYQSCNDHVCLPPRTETVEAPLSTN